MLAERKVGFIENTAMRHRWGGGREVTATSRLDRQKDKERQRKTEENVDGRPVGAPRAGVRWMTRKTVPIIDMDKILGFIWTAPGTL